MIRYFVSFLTLLIACQASAALLSPRTYNKLNDIQESINGQPGREQQIEINEQLVELAEDLQGNSLGLALTWQTHAQLKLLNDNYKLANMFLAKAIKLKGLDNSTQFQLKSFYAQILFIEERHKEVIVVLMGLINNSDFKASASVFSLLAAAHYSINDFKSGLPFIVNAIALKEKANADPKEAWLQMAFSGYYQLKNFSEALYYTNLLVLNFPDKKDYWQQKSGMHQLSEDYSSAAGSKELSYKKNFLKKESDYISLGQLLASQGDAFKVGVALEQAMLSERIESSEKSLRLMQQAWMQAKEMAKAQQALSLLFTKFKHQKDGIRLMQYLVDDEQWNQALAAGKVLQGLTLTEKQQGNLLLLNGICQFRSGDARLALNSLSKAVAIKSSASQAKGWMSYIKQLQQG